jgi:hypothetical protein
MAVGIPSHAPAFVITLQAEAERKSISSLWKAKHRNMDIEVPVPQVDTIDIAPVPVCVRDQSLLEAQIVLTLRHRQCEQKDAQ